MVITFESRLSVIFVSEEPLALESHTIQRPRPSFTVSHALFSDCIHGPHSHPPHSAPTPLNAADVDKRRMHPSSHFCPPALLPSCPRTIKIHTRLGYTTYNTIPSLLSPQSSYRRILAAFAAGHIGPRLPKMLPGNTLDILGCYLLNTLPTQVGT